MAQSPRVQCQDDGESDERQKKQKGPMVQVAARSGRSTSPVAGRQRSSGSRRRSPGKSHTRSFRRGSGSHCRRSACEDGQQQQQQSTSISPKMKRNTSSGRLSPRRRGSGSHHSRGVLSPRRASGSHHSRNNNNNSRRGSRSPVSQRTPLPTLNGSGLMTNNKKPGDRSKARRKTKPISRRSIASGGDDLGTKQINVFQTLERGLNSEKPSLVQSDVSESSSSDPTTTTTTTTTTLEKRHTVPSLDNKPTAESLLETSKRSSDPVKLELDGGAQRQAAAGRRFSWWTLPSARDLECVEDDDDDDDNLLPPVVPPSRRSSIMSEEAPGKPNSSKMLTPKSSKSSFKKKKKKKTSRTNSVDSMDSGFTMTTDAESGSFQADDSSGSLLLFSPTVQKVAMGEDLVSPLPSIPMTRQPSNRTIVSAESINSSGSANTSTSKKKSSKERRSSKKSKRKSGKEKTKSTSSSVVEKKKKDHLDSNNTKSRGGQRTSLGDHFNRSMMNASFNRSMNRSCDFSAQSSNTKKSRTSRTSMSIKKQNSMDASRSSMMSWTSFNNGDGGGGGDNCSIGSSDFESTSADFDFEDDITQDGSIDPFAMMSSSTTSDAAGFFDGEDSFQVVDNDFKRALRSRMKGKTQRSSNGAKSNARSPIRQDDKKSPIVTSMEQGIVIM